MTSHRGLFGWSAFFVDNLWSNSNRVEKGSIVLALSFQIDWYAVLFPLLNPWPEEGDLALTSESTLTLTFTKQKIYHLKRLDERIKMVLDFGSAATFGRNQEPKTKPRPLGHWLDLCDHRLTWDIKFSYQSLRLVTTEMLFFLEALAQLGAKRREWVVPPRPGPYVENRYRQGVTVVRVNTHTWEGEGADYAPTCFSRINKKQRRYLRTNQEYILFSNFDLVG